MYDLTGQMVAVGLPADEITATIGLLDLRQTCVACFNGPKGQTVSGAKAEVDELKKHFLGVYGKERLFGPGFVGHAELVGGQVHMASCTK